MSTATIKLAEGENVDDAGIDVSEIAELGDQFFKDAVLTRPGESVIDAIAKKTHQHCALK